MTQERTTLTGKPIPAPQHDSLSNVMLSDGGAGFNASTVGANLLPPGYTDKSLVRIPIKISDYMSNAPIKAEKKTGFLSKVLGKGGRKDDGLKVVEMSRGEYLKYWAKGEDGKFLDSVVEPPGERGEWVRRQVEFQQEMKGGGMVEKPNLLSAAVAGLGSS